MGNNTFGKDFCVTIIGESHGPGVGTILDGCPAGLAVSVEDIQRELDRRIPPDPILSSARREKDEVQIFSGVFEGYTTGAPVTLLTWNKDVRSQDYEKLKVVARPGHADYPTRMKYGGFNDLRGGGRASGRLTAPIMMAGAVAKKLLQTVGIQIFAHTIQIHTIKLQRLPSLAEIEQNVFSNSIRCADPETAEKMREAILNARSEGDSVGGIVECIAIGVPPGIGDPFFDNLDGELAKIAFSIPAVKGFEVGLGFKSSAIRGSENNDPYAIVDNKVATLTNNSGGILGGLSNGMPIVVHVAFKPTSSIPKEQKTVNLKEMRDTTVQVTGRHDPCIVPKAVPVVEAVVAIVLADHCQRSGRIPRVIGKKELGQVNGDSKLQPRH
ncbi:MAG TPA: chorismate synthase [Candidatus Saccharimonadales bacterium]|nr:chorismate synthase [Candidatus Saccharimonadales bacterium]